METDFPEGQNATLKIELTAPKKLTLSLRRPSWAGNGFTVQVNGKTVKNLASAGSYIELNRTWKTGDRITLTLPKALHLEAAPDNPQRAAILWGPLVLAGDLGPDSDEAQQKIHEQLPVFVAANRAPGEWLQPVPGHAGEFRSVGVGREREVDLVPFYRLHRRTYEVYWDLFTPEGWKLEAAKIAAKRERQRQLEAATVELCSARRNAAGA